MNNPEVTVIITTFRRKVEYLQRAIDSVINQTFKNLELIVVDDNGKKGAYSDIFKEVDIKKGNLQKVRYIQHEVNRGAQAARNSGILSSNGRYIAFLDDDDEWLPEKIEYQYKKFIDSDDPKLGLVYCGHYYVNQSLTGTNIKLIEPKYRLCKKSSILYRENVIGSTSFPLIKRECFDKVGLFDISLNAKQDYDMWIRINQHYKVDFINQPLVNYYVHSGERISTNVEKKLEAEMLFFDRYLEYIKKDKKALSQKNKLIGLLYFRLNDFINSRRYLSKSVLANPFRLTNYIYLLLCIFRIKPKFMKKYIER